MLRIRLIFRLFLLLVSTIAVAGDDEYLCRFDEVTSIETPAQAGQVAYRETFWNDSQNWRFLANFALRTDLYFSLNFHHTSARINGTLFQQIIDQLGAHHLAPHRIVRRYGRQNAPIARLFRQVHRQLRARGIKVVWGQSTHYDPNSNQITIGYAELLRPNPELRILTALAGELARPASTDPVTTIVTIARQEIEMARQIENLGFAGVAELLSQQARTVQLAIQFGRWHQDPDIRAYQAVTEFLRAQSQGEEKMPRVVD